MYQIVTFLTFTEEESEGHRGDGEVTGEGIIIRGEGIIIR